MQVACLLSSHYDVEYKVLLRALSLDYGSAAVVRSRLPRMRLFEDND